MPDAVGKPVEPVDVRPVGPERRAEFLALDQWAFAFDDSEVDPAPSLSLIPWDRAFGAFDGSTMIGQYASFSFELTVPGGAAPGVVVPAAGLTWVGVHPQYRRRGVLTALMRHHLDDVRARHEPVSALFAAEPAIYGRFGYGLASRALALTLGRGAALRDVPGTDGVQVRFEKADAETHSALVQDCREAVRLSRPGEMSRPGTGMQRYVFDDQRPWRRGAETMRIAVAEDSATSRVRGYALFRRKLDWGEGAPEGKVTVRELTATDPAAARALWGRLTDLDLMASLQTDPRPLDDPLLSMLVDLRATTPRLSDNLWVRVLDVPGALAGRRYAAEIDVVLEVGDRTYPGNDGRWRLRGGPDKAECELTDRPADVSLDVRELGAAYLGGTSLLSLAGAGLVAAASPEVLLRTSAAFTSPVAPICGYMF